ncbi:hypothetical protein JTE90_001417 [Oedothorax gibbosus]|uniref:receptor protein serine/threonine kinase n=1 Tax=Oedothorax gibbosus TaxID=931172 RepID=A0AAV6VF18_9ARAC|nr:hypothetical protein JTE90_001417 [Oedothorax gibbosus]
MEDSTETNNRKSHDDKSPLCYYLKTPIIRQINVTVGSLLDGNTTEKCAKSTDSCYILWKEDPKNKSITIISQGCWNDADQKCQQTECIPSPSTKALDNTHFCCCVGNYCNTNITDVKNSSDCCEDDPTPQFLGHMTLAPMQIALIVLGVFTVILPAFIFICHKYYRQIPKQSNSSLYPMEEPPSSSPSFDLDTLKIQEAVARGRYGSVYKASLDEESVAVKKFVYQNQQHFLNERAIYLLPHMEHPSLPKYIGSKEQTGEDGRTEFLLVVSFSPLGCLQDYLRANTIDWNSLCKMTLSIARGLAHLHSELKKGDKFKPCIVHRDVTSRNILVKMDGTCMLCDFGFAIQISGSTYVLNGTEVKAEETSLSDVGTLRYMAPEILEGAVNLRDCESSLKQTDVYALGLIIWEIATRCVDLYQGVEIPPFKLPYEVEVGTDPTMEKMQTLVVKHKSRPLFPDIWKTTNPAIRSLKETIEDCWDQDAEARLTTLCVEERITELPVLWERDKAGLTVSTQLSPSINPLSNLKKSPSYNTNKSSLSSDFPSEIIEDRIVCPNRERTNSMSTEGTTETLLSPSDTVNQANDKNRALSHFNSVPKLSYPLQPHQGRNPCLARNLMRDLPNDQEILDGSQKYNGSKRMISFSDGDANIFSLPPGMESNLMRNPTKPAIPYVQNQVTNNIPKETNLTGNCRHPAREFLQKTERRWNPLNMRNLRAGFKMLLDRKSSASHGHIPEEQQPLKSSGISSPVSPSDGNGQTNPVNGFWAAAELKDEDQAHFRVICSEDLSTADGNAVMKSYDHHLLNGHAIAVNHGKKVLNLSSHHQRPTTLQIESGEDVENDIIIDMSDSEEAPKDSASDQATVSDSKPIRRKGSGSRKKVVRRVKTPFEIKSRFSLYDDRIMSSQELPSSTCVVNVSQTQLGTAKFSASVPLNMNTLCFSPQNDHLPLQNDHLPPQNDHLQDDPKIQVKDKRANGHILPPVIANGQQSLFSLCDI